MSYHNSFIEVTRLDGGKPTKYLINTQHVISASYDGKKTILTTIVHQMSIQESYEKLSQMLLSKPQPEAIDDWTLNIGVQPVSSHRYVEVQFRNGDSRESPAGEWYWCIDGDKDDIIKWRLAKGDA